MKRTLFRIFSLLSCAALLSVSFTGFAGAKIPSPSRFFYVYDEANVLSLTTEDHIISVNEKLDAACGAQIVVACVNTTGTADIADYAYKLFNKWEIGSAEKKNGVLLLLSIEEGDYYALQGKGLENLLSSGTLKLMLDDYLEPSFSAGDYDAGAKEMFDAVAKFLSEVYSVTLSELTTAPAPTQAPTQVQQSTEPEDWEDTTFDLEDWLLDFDSTFPFEDVLNGSFLSGAISGITSGAFVPFRILKRIIEHITLSRIIVIVVVILILRALLKGRRRGGGGGSRGGGSRR